MADTIRSKAGHVLATSDDDDARSVASYVLAGGEPVYDRPERTRDDLERLLRAVEGREGYREREDMIRALLSSLDE